MFIAITLTAFFLGVAGVAALVYFIIVVYNRLVRLRVAARTAWSDINVYLKKRYELVPNLVETVKGYAAHESKVFENVAKHRSVAMHADAPTDKGKAENMLTGTLKSLFAVSEAYPDLQADDGFRQLQSQLQELDGSIEQARHFYNARVQDYNSYTQVFPSNIVAAAFRFVPEGFFELDAPDVEQKAVKVRFD